MKQTLRTVFTILLVVGMTGLAHAYSSNPPQGRAGDPPAMNNCTGCHSSFPVNSGDGMLSLEGITDYEPGETYTLTVNLDDDGQQRWGFQIIAKATDTNIIQGSFTITDPTHTRTNGSYVNHNSAGTYNGQQDGASWSFDWTAPQADVGDITFYFAGNAANGNFNTSGDYIYTESHTVSAVQPLYTFDTQQGDDFVPAQGGTIPYTVSLTTNVPQAFPGVTYWTTVTLPNGTETQPVFSVTLTVPPFADFSNVPLSLDVPGFAPAGDYMHNAKLGFFPNAVATDSWNFTKGANATDGAVVPHWDAHGSFEIAGEANGAAAPSEFKLNAAYPNPFNNMTTVSVALPQTAELTVNVVNILGETVATLADGQFGAGTQEFVFNAAGMSSGVYFIQAQVPGELNAVQKVTLVQ